MSGDIKLTWDFTESGELTTDVKYAQNDLAREYGIETAVIISLFTDARALDDDALDDPDDKRGWWGDLLDANENIITGSRLWILDRSKTNAEAQTRVQAMMLEALQWMIDEGIAANIEVETWRFGISGNDRLGAQIKIYQQFGDIVAISFDDLWRGQYAVS